MENKFEQHVEKELKSMDQRLEDLEGKITSIDTKLSQVVDAILGNPLTKDGGVVNEIKILKTEVALLKSKLELQEEFKNRILWTVGIIVAIAAFIQFATGIYKNIKP
jgi:uncharacterized protein YicC (UPF0701 family)